MASTTGTIITKDDLKILPTLIGSSNYPIWANRMQAFFTHKKLWDTVIRNPGANPNARTRELLSETANILVQKIGDRIYNGIVTPKRMLNGHKIWMKIKRVYGTSTAHKITRALTCWQNLCFDGNLNTFVEQVESCLEQFDTISHIQGEGAICGAIIAKISVKQGGLTDSLIMNNQLMGSSELLIEKLKDLANHDEFTHKNNHSEQSITAPRNHARTRPITCKNGVHNPNVAHPESKCWALHPDQRPVKRLNNRHANNTSGASSNLTTRISDPPSEYDKPAFANYTIAQSFSTQMGTAAVIQDSGKVVLLEGALYVPDLTRNLISLGKLIRDSVLIEKVGGSHVVNIDDGIRFTCSMINGALEVNSHIGPISASYTAISLATHSAPTTPFRTWHSQLGHASFARIKAAVPNEKLETTGHWKRYFLTLVDQHTGYISVTLLKQKSEAMDAFLAFKIFFEKQTGHFIQKLITDGGGEFVNKSLNNALESFGIQHNISPPYTPQHNGVAERANKTIINMARCMLSQSNLAKEWWGEAFRTAMAVTNCLPSVCRGKVSPIQLMFGKRPNYGVF
ncbi:hypothetical protein PCASD_25224 [Puccinia coronata f. sp. avenae]|uniref:Integrase catalytic domain-containing protein n=1 Tax=Puccinia coronata f. sp. avenae TaxID=200324 RepID=A0A2N5TLN7_9BASI|nr:hypothetical protein PCASD_25224 [Puccinia coronata f. sp. avenae]